MSQIGIGGGDGGGGDGGDIGGDDGGGGDGGDGGGDIKVAQAPGPTKVIVYIGYSWWAVTVGAVEAHS